MQQTVEISDNSKQTANKLLKRSKFKGNDVNVTLLEASLREYNSQLTYHLLSPIHQYFSSMYTKALNTAKQSESHSRNCRDLRLLQEELRKIPKFNTDEVDREVAYITERINKKFRFAKVLKIIFVARSMIMASVRPKSRADEEIVVAVPSVEAYTHRVLSLVARHLFTYPSLIRKSDNESEKDASAKSRNITKIIFDSVMNAVTDMLPHDEICDTYLSETIKAEHLQSTEDSTSTGIANTSAIAPDASIKPGEPQQQQTQPIESSYLVDDMGFGKGDDLEYMSTDGSDASEITASDNNSDESSSGSDDDSDSGGNTKSVRFAEQADAKHQKKHIPRAQSKKASGGRVSRRRMRRV